MRQTRFDLLGEHSAHIDFEVWLQAPETPRLGGLVRRSCFRKCEWVARARPRRIQSDSAHYAMVGMKSIRKLRNEGRQNVWLSAPDIRNKLLTQPEHLDQPGIVVRAKHTAMD